MAGRDDPGLAAAVPFRFECSRCGHCCSGGDGHVWLQPGEVDALAAALGAGGAAFAATHVRSVSDPRTGERRLALAQGRDGRCSLLAGRNTCRAYDARPEHCRAFPYWPSVMAGGAGFEAARATCPGIAVVVESGRRQRAFAALEGLYRRLDASAAPAGEQGCCLDGARADDLYMSALEADHAAERGTRDPACRLGPARPLGCRVARAGADGERWRGELRAIERGEDYPAAYGEARALLRARGVRITEVAP